MLLQTKTNNYYKKYIELWNEIKYLTETINGGKSGEYGKDFMKIKIDSDDNLLLNKPVNFMQWQ